MSWSRKRKRRLEFSKRKVPSIKKTNWENPFFKRKQYRGPLGGRGKYYALILFIATIYFFFFSGYFHVVNLKITGTHYLSEDQVKPIAEEFIKSRKWFVLPQDNLILTDTNRLHQDIQQSLSNQLALASLEIQKDYPDTININIIERIPSLTWVTNNIRYYLDLNGYVASRVEVEEELDANFPKIYDLANQEVTLGQEILSTEFVSFVFAVFGQWQERINGEQSIDSFHYNGEELPDLWLRSQAGWRVYLDSTRSAEEQITEAGLILQEYFRDSRDNLDYIDVRLPDKVYYKTKY